MKISEQAFDAQELANLTSFANSVYPLLPGAAVGVPPIIVIDESLYKWQSSGIKPIAELSSDELIYAIGTLWGNIIVEKCRWRWVTLIYHDFDNWKGLAVVSPDGSLAILPFAHIHECFGGTDEVKISASLSALGANIIPKYPPNTFENVMHGLQRILPRG